MSALLKRAHRVLLITVAAVFGLTLLAPMATLANTDLSVGDQATISNPNGTGANLRSDFSVLDESTVLGEIPDGTTVTVTDGPYFTDSGVWFWVWSESGEGFVSGDLLAPASTAPVEEPVAEEVAEEPVAEEEPTSPDLLWQEPIDAGFVVDDNNSIPAGGLACRTTPTVDGDVMTRIPVNATLEVVSERIWQGEQSFVHVNCGDGAGYVNGTYVVLQSEQAQEPVAEEPAVEEPVDEVAEEPVVEEPVVEEPVVDEVVEEVAEDVVEESTEAPAESEVTEEPATEDPAPTGETGPRFVTDNVNLRDAASADSNVVDVLPVGYEVNLTGMVGDGYVEVTGDFGTGWVAPEFLGVEPPVVEVPTEDVVDEPTEVPTEDVVETEVPVDEGLVEATPEPTDAVEEPTEVPTEDAVEEPTEAPTEEVVEEPTEVPTEEVVEEPTEAPTEEIVEEPTEVATDEVAEEATEEDEGPAAATFDASAMIGSATVTGTNGDGLVCRVSPDDGAATLMVLAEGTTVLVSAEAVNGYLGIDCGGFQGYADVNFLWSGGAGDDEITNSSMTLVVSGTGNGLNCRTGAGTSHPVITVLRDGQTVTTRAAASNGWVAVVCGGQNGFVSTPYVEVRSGSGGSGSTGTASGTATVANTGGDGLYCRSGAGASYSAITVLSPGQSVTVRGANQGAWTPVVCGGVNGFAHSSFLSIGSSSGGGSGNGSSPAPSTGSVTVANTGGAGLNCRSGAGTGHGVITVLRAGQTVSARSGSTGGWQAVVCGGQNGFVSSEFISGGGSGTTPNPNPNPGTPPSDNGQTATVSNTGGDGLYCRSGAGSGNSVITVLSPGQQVPVRGNSSNGWVPITCGGQAGWASGQFLTIGGGSSNPTPPPTNPAPGGLQNGDHAKVSANLNLRYQASLGSGVAAVAPSGTVVLVTGGASNGFYPVDWDGLRGFMSSDYLSKTNEALSQRGGSGSPTNPPPGGGGGGATGNAIVDYAMRYIGYPYVWATHGPSSFDCSGFTYWVIMNVTGKNIGTGTWTQVSAGTTVSRNNLQPGDLVFFQNTYTAGLSHVGIYIGNNQFIHAQNESTGVVISDLNSSYYAPRWYGAVRI